MMKALIVDRYRRKEDSLYRYTTTVGLDAFLDKATADQHPQAETWMVDSMLNRLIGDLINLRNRGGEVVFRTHGDDE